jgi:glycosyltransferase involved in cell wall biosynthesis
MKPLISICIPTYQRPELLAQAIDSCLAQTYADIEIIICDDSKNDQSKKLLHTRYQDERIRYYRNSPSLGQAGNVNRLFSLAQGERLVLLHDDDLLLPTALSDLDGCWHEQPNIVAAFGKQQIIDMDSKVDEKASRGLNEIYHRTAQLQGVQASALWSALVAQFPNNSYMVLTKAATNIGYRDVPDVGDICDYDFGLRLAGQFDGFYFIDRYTSQYRITNNSISKNNNHAHLSFDLVASLTLPYEIEATRDARLRNYSPAAVNKWLTLGNRQKAAEIYYSRHYPTQKRWSSKGLIQFVLTCCPHTITRRFMAMVLRAT